MAGYTHKYDTDGMRTKAQEIGKIGAEYDQTMGKLTSLVQNLQQVWDAPATRVFQDSYAEFQGTFQNFYEKMLRYADELKLAANEQDQKNADDAQRATRLNG